MMKVTGYLLCVIMLCLSHIGLSHASETASVTTVDSPTSPIAPATSHPQPVQQTAEKTQPLKSGRPVAGEFTSVSAPDIGGGLIQVTFGLFVVLMIIAAAAWFTRRFGSFQATAGGALRIIGGLHLGAKERLVVIQVGEEQLLLGVAPGRISKLHVLEKPLNMSGDCTTQGAGGVKPGSFREYLTAVLKR